MGKTWKCLTFVSVFVLAAPVFGQQAANSHQASAEAVTGPTDSGSKKPATTDPNYIIGPQDILDINVWKEPTVTRTVPVRPDGKISLPLLDDIQAAGLTPMQLSDSLAQKLKKFIADPQVTVIVSQINSQRVYVIGSVGRPGAYPLVPGMTILQALSSAGGFTAFANEKKIFLLRTVNGRQTKQYFNYKDVINGKNPGQNLIIEAGDTIVVP
jgi:polysaccharide biosynthesis/export protein